MRHYAGASPSGTSSTSRWPSTARPRRRVWRRFIGPDHVELALRAARAADPKAKLFINEYGVEGPGRKLEGLVDSCGPAEARRAAGRHRPADAHHILGFYDQATLASTMRRFAAMGLEVQVTEMDVGTSLLGSAPSIG